MRTFISVITGLLLSGYSWSQCSISYSSSISGSTVSLSPIATTSGSALNVWDSPGGNPSSQSLSVSNNATVTYNALGSYNICVNMYDSSWNCADTFCDNVVINVLNVTASISSINPSCTASQCSGSATASATGGTSPYTYAWSSGATASTISNLCSGTYTVTVTDLNGLMSTASTTLVYDTAAGMTIAFSSSMETCPNCCDGFISANVSGGSGSYSYWWNFDTTLNSPVATGLCGGNYVFRATDQNTGCFQTSSEILPTYTCNDFLGYVHPAGGDSRVYFIQEAGGVLWAHDSIDVDSSFFYYDSLCPGTYYIKAALLPTNPLYASYIPTYHGGAVLWSNALPFTMVTNQVWSFQIQLVSGINLGGPGFIAGAISQGANRNEGDPVIGATVIVFDDEGEAIRYAISDQEGKYTINQLPLGSYTVQVDLINKTSYAHEITITEENPGGFGYNFEVQGNIIKPVDATGVSDMSASRVQLFPNPTSTSMWIQCQSNQVKWSLYTLLGDQIMNGKVNSSGNGLIEVEMVDLPAGNYILEIETESESIAERIIKL
ncbi:MAG: T9SS type A sorting domain-containing protein [Flavobacteriales bacterium]